MTTKMTGLRVATLAVSLSSAVGVWALIAQADRAAETAKMANTPPAPQAQVVAPPPAQPRRIVIKIKQPASSASANQIANRPANPTANRPANPPTRQPQVAIPAMPRLAPIPALPQMPAMPAAPAPNSRSRSS